MASSVTHTQMATSAVTVTTTSETVLDTSDILTLAPLGGEGNRVHGVLNFTTGAGTTAVVVRVRQNTLTGTVVGNAQTVTAAAAATLSIPYDVLDVGAASTPVQQYVVTIQQTAATGNGTGNQTTISVTPVSSAN